jgi:hypothetical protein
MYNNVHHIVGGGNKKLKVIWLPIIGEDDRENGVCLAVSSSCEKGCIICIHSNRNGFYHRIRSKKETLKSLMQYYAFQNAHT